MLHCKTLSPAYAGTSTSRRNASPRSSKSRNWSKLAHAGESRTTSPGSASPAARRTAVARSCGAERRRDRGQQLGRRLADRVDRADVRAERGRERCEVLALARAADDQAQRPVGVGRDPAAGGGDVRRLRVVDVAARRAARGPARAGAARPGRSRSASRDPFLRGAGGAGRGGRGGGVLAVVLAGDQRLGRERVVPAELDPPRRARHRPEAARDDRGVVGPLVLEQAQLRVAVGLEGAVPVEVVGLEVQQDGHRRPELVDVLELEATRPRRRRARPARPRRRAPSAPGPRCPRPARRASRRAAPTSSSCRSCR